MEEEDLFLETGNSDEMGTIREALDTGADFPAKLDPHSMPETLLRFLESLDMPVVPYQLYNNVRFFPLFFFPLGLRFTAFKVDSLVSTCKMQQVLQAAAQQSSTQAKAVIAKLPEVYYNTFFYVIAFLREVLQLSAKNKLTPEKLAFVFSSVLVRPPPGTRQTEASLKKQAAFIQHFLAVTDLQMTLPPPKSLSEGTAAATNQ
jgi:phosphatidylinositol-bisphosphatase